MATDKPTDEGTPEAETATGILGLLILLVQVLELNGALQPGQFAANLEHQLATIPEGRETLRRHVPMRLVLRALTGGKGGGLQ